MSIHVLNRVDVLNFADLNHLSRISPKYIEKFPLSSTAITDTN